MDMDFVPTLINNSQFYETEAIMEATSLNELADALLGVDLPNIPSNTLDPEWDFGYDLVDQFLTTPSYNSASSDDSNSNSNNNDNNNNDDESVKNLVGSGDDIHEKTRRSKKRKIETEKKVNEGKARRKRDPNQVQDHIKAERKRREVLSHMFIRLSSMIPGLKKMDKTTILGDAIKHMEQLQEKVKQLELATAQHNNNTTNKSTVVVKEYQLPMIDDNNDNGSSSIIVDDISGSGGGSGANGGGNNNNADNYIDKKSSLPQIEVRRSDNTILFKIYCEKRKGILSKLIAMVDRHDYLSITSSVVIPFDNFTVDVTIVAQMEEGFNDNVEGLVRSLCSALRSTTGP